MFSFITKPDTLKVPKQPQQIVSWLNNEVNNNIEKSRIHPKMAKRYKYDVIGRPGQVPTNESAPGPRSITGDHLMHIVRE